MSSPRFEQESSAKKLLKNQLDEDIRYLVRFLFRLKAPAFNEEHEVRLFSYLLKFGNKKCQHRTVGDRIIPYRPFSLNLETSPIVEVVLGPKHATPAWVVKDFLKQNNFGDVQVELSSASYR
jgi:hypothetical protein